VETTFHHPNDLCELPKVIGLRRSQWMLFEERNDTSGKISRRSHVEPEEILPVIVVSPIDANATASKELLQLMQNVHTPLSLDHREGWLCLPTDSVGPIAVDRNAEASFAVYEADDPLLETWPFLLIARTGWIVTGHAPTLPGGSDMTGTTGCSGVPAYSQLHFTLSPA